MTKTTNGLPLELNEAIGDIFNAPKRKQTMFRLTALERELFEVWAKALGFPTLSDFIRYLVIEGVNARVAHARDDHFFVTEKDGLRVYDFGSGDRKVTLSDLKEDMALFLVCMEDFKTGHLPAQIAPFVLACFFELSNWGAK